MNAMRAGVFYLILLAVAIVLFYPFFIKGYVLNGNPDRPEQIVPFHVYYQRSFKSMEIPQWNPYIFAGTAAMGSGLYVFFYPVYWMGYLLPESWLPDFLTLVLILHFLIAGAFSFKLFGRLSGDNYWAACASMAYLLSSASVTNMTQSNVDFSTTAYLPVLLYLLYVQHEMRFLKAVTCQTFVLVMLFLSGNLHLCFYAFSLYFFLALYRSVDVNNGIALNRRGLAGNAVSIVLALGISAVRLIPSYYATRSYGNVSATYDIFNVHSRTHVAYLLRLFSPEFFGDNLRNFASLRIGWYGHHGETFSCYVGLACAFLAVYSLCFIWNRKTLFWNLAIIAIVLIVLGTPITMIHYFITGRSSLQFRKLAWFLPICFSSLVAINGKELMAKRIKSLCIFSTVVFVLVLFSMRLLYSRYFSAGFNAANSKIMTFSTVYLIVLYGGMIAILCLVYKRGSHNAIFKAPFFLFLLADLLIVAAINANSGADFFCARPFFRFSRAEIGLARQLKRMGNEYRALWGGNDRNIILDVYNTCGYDNSPPKLICDLNTVPAEVHRKEIVQLRPQHLRIKQLTSTAYVLDKGRIKEVAAALPRANLFTRYLVVPDDKAAINKLLDPSFDFRDVAVLAERPMLDIEDLHEPGAVRIVKDSFGEVEIDVNARVNCILLLNDTYNEGWGVSVDGSPARLIRGNYAFRAVEIPVGNHRVRFSYRQRGINSGMAIMSISLVVCFVALVRIIYREQGRFEAVSRE
jgi:hypothetical protein